MKKSFKKILVTILCLSIVTAISACSKKSKTATTQSNASEKITLEFWHYWDGNNGTVINELVEKFNEENSNIEVKPVFIPGGELMTKLQVAINSKTTPALAAADISGMAKLKSTDKLLDLNNYLKDNNVDINSFYPSLLEYGKKEGKLYSLPVSTNNLALFYNKDMFKKAGIDPNKPPKTWEELRKYSETIVNKISNSYGFEFYTQVGDSGEGLTWQLQPYLWQAKADFIKDGEAAFNNEGGEKALNFLTGMINDKLTPVGSWNDFDKGNCAMVVDGTWMVGIWKDSLNFDFGTAMIPMPEDGEHATNMGGEQIFAFNKDENINSAAAKFIAYMVDANTQIVWDEKTTFMPIRKEVAENQDYLNWVNNTEPRLLPFIEQQKYAHARPCLEEYPAASLGFAKEIEKAYFGKITVKEALSNAEKAVNSALEK
ncbi:ABC transporter substrate-binding protein [Clostridium sediminicola]|uniref:ABC transporter substrate-binding protein n=1 Tax=Clostridium sediminicola TaxID=3114879 RepID=UPI0031F221C5